MTDDFAFSDLEQALIKAGSVAAAAARVGERAASEAIYSLTLKAPEEMQPSWPLVISWSRLQIAYEVAQMMGDADGMRKISESQTKMLKDLY